MKISSLWRGVRQSFLYWDLSESRDLLIYGGFEAILEVSNIFFDSKQKSFLKFSIFLENWYFSIKFVEVGWHTLRLTNSHFPILSCIQRVLPIVFQHRPDKRIDHDRNESSIDQHLSSVIASTGCERRAGGDALRARKGILRLRRERDIAPSARKG